jgi:hypothetical protein
VDFFFTLFPVLDSYFFPPLLGLLVRHKPHQHGQSHEEPGQNWPGKTRPNFFCFIQ